MDANSTARLTRLLSIMLLPFVVLAWAAELIIVLKDALNGRFDTFSIVVWAFTGMIGFLLVANLRTKPRAKL